jgi:hypothetical protein
MKRNFGSCVEKVRATTLASACTYDFLARFAAFGSSISECWIYKGRKRVDTCTRDGL